MPVTKTAKRALRSSKRKARVNTVILTNLEIAIRVAKKGKQDDKIKKAVSLTDRAKKKKVISQNRAARIKSALAKLNTKKTENKKSNKIRKTTKSK